MSDETPSATPGDEEEASTPEDPGPQLYEGEVQLTLGEVASASVTSGELLALAEAAGIDVTGEAVA